MFTIMTGVDEAMEEVIKGVESVFVLVFAWRKS